MHVLKKIGFWLAFIFFSAFLVLSLVVPPVTLHITDRESVKSWINNPEVLDGITTVVPEIISESLSEEGAALVEIGDTPIGVDVSQLSDSVKEVLTPEYISGKTDPIIDGVYAWLEGETEVPVFEVDFSDRLNAVVTAIEGPLKSELAKLPDCPANIEHTEDFNPIETPCVPQGIDIDRIISTFSEFATGDRADIEIKVSSEDIEFSDDVLEYGPRVHSGLSAMPVFFGVMTLLFGLTAVFLADSKVKGLRLMSWSMVFNAAIIAVGFWLLTKIRTFESSAGDPTEELIFQEVVTPLLRGILRDIGNTGLALSLAILVLGITIWLLTHIHRKVHDEHKAHKKSQKKLGEDIPTARQESLYLNKLARDTNKKKPKKTKKK